MAFLQRVRVALTGFPGGPGVSTFYALNGEALLAPLAAFYFSRIADYPAVVNFTFEGTGDIIDPLTGALTGSWSGAAPQPFAGSNTGSYAAPSGLTVNWNTGTVLDGHRLRGRTFLVPLSQGSYQNDGSLADATLNGFRAAAAELVTAAASNLVVWHRPRLLPQRAGGYSIVTSSTVNDRVAVLRSRRD